MKNKASNAPVTFEEIVMVMIKSGYVLNIPVRLILLINKTVFQVIMNVLREMQLQSESIPDLQDGKLIHSLKGTL